MTGLLYAPGMKSGTVENPAQQAAIELTEGPLRIMAGAGTGKTSTLTKRILHLIDRGLARPSQILALTFTNKAVDELRSRVEDETKSLATGGERVDVDTYHAFGARIVNEFGSRMGLPADPVVLTQAESWILLWRGLDEMELEYTDFGDLQGFYGKSPLLRMIAIGSRLNDELKTLDDVEAWLHTATDRKRFESLSDAARALAWYQQRKRELGAIDFGDQIALACQLLAEPEVADIVGQRYRYVMVDEFQDTNYAQSIMVQRLVAAAHRNICVVGDPNQAIYAFRGAAPDNLERFANETFPDAVTLTLSDNYRSTQEILDLANSIWPEGSDPYRGNLRTGRKAFGPRPLLVEAEEDADELAWIAAKIADLVETRQYQYRDIAVIARKKKVNRRVFATLRDHGIPAEMIGIGSIYDTPEVREIISWLRLVANHRHDAAFAYVLLSERCGLDERALYDIAQHRTGEESLLETARRLVLDGDASDELTGLIGSLAHLVQRSYAGIEPLLDEIIGLREGASDPLEADNIERFAEIVRGFTSSRLATPDLQEFLAWLELLLIAGADDEAATDFTPGLANRVSIITAHAAKGLEWPVVFVAFCNFHDFFSQGRVEQGLLPLELTHEEPGRPLPEDFASDPKGQTAYAKALHAWQKAVVREEEFRALYVALTRAKERLFVSWARNTPSRKGQTDLHPALVDAADLFERIDAPPAETRGVSNRLKTIAPQLMTLLAPLLPGNDAQTPSAEQVAATLQMAATEFSLPVAVLEDAWQQFQKADQLMQSQIAELAIAEAASQRPEQRDEAPFVLSFSQLDSWERCPHLYYLRYVRQLPGAPRRWATGYGSAVHRALEAESARRQIGLPPSTADELRAAVARDPDSASNISERRLASSGAIDPIDAWFHSPDAAAEVLLREQGFALRFGDGIVIHGVIDRVHRLPDGTAEVVDYKTNRYSSKPEEIRRGLQLPIYLIACQELFPEIQPPPERAVLFNLRHNVRTEVQWTPAELDAVRQRVIAGATTMRQADPSLHNARPDLCRSCDYRDACQFSAYRG